MFICFFCNFLFSWGSNRVAPVTTAHKLGGFCCVSHWCLLLPDGIRDVLLPASTHSVSSTDRWSRLHFFHFYLLIVICFCLCVSVCVFISVCLFVYILLNVAYWFFVYILKLLFTLVYALFCYIVRFCIVSFFISWFLYVFLCLWCCYFMSTLWCTFVNICLFVLRLC